MAKISDKFTTVRGFHQNSASHGIATVNVNTGITGRLDQPMEPSYGSIVAHQFGTNAYNGVPNYVKVGNFRGTEPVWMGKKYDGFVPTSEGIGNLSSRVPQERLDERLSLIIERDVPGAESWKDLRDQATGILRGSAAEAFKIELEPKEVQEAYGVGKSSIGRDFLKARRLVESKSRFVTINIGGWDNHSGLSANFARRGVELDKYLAVLISDLADRGMSNTLVVVTSEFARTPKINGNASRDHWAQTGTLILAGGNSEHGRVIGSTNTNGQYVVSGEYLPRDLLRTITDHMGIDHNLTVMDPENRPRHIVNHESRNILV
jgi:hypothetical protein